MQTKPLPHHFGRLPLVTLGLALCSLVISCSALSHILQYDRNGLAAGQLWLLVTGHLSHWSSDNLFWDLLVFLVLGTLAERRSRRGLLLCLSLSTVLISALLWFRLEEILCYRGLSGLDSALFAWTALWLVRERFNDRDYRGVALILIASLAFLAKIGYETLTLQSVFSSSAGLFIPVPLAHLCGGVVGIGVALLSRRDAIAHVSWRQSRKSEKLLHHP